MHDLCLTFSVMQQDRKQFTCYFSKKTDTINFFTQKTTFL